MGRFLLFAIAFVVVLYALIDVILSRGDDIRSLPKPLWVVVVLVLPVLGAIGWFVVGGRPRPVGEGGGMAPGRGRARRPVAPDDDPAFLRQIDDLTWSEKMRRRREGRDGGATPEPTPAPSRPRRAVTCASHVRTRFCPPRAGDVRCTREPGRARHAADAPAASGGHPVLVYTGLRLLLLVITAGVLYLVGLRNILAAGVRVPHLRRDLDLRPQPPARGARSRWSRPCRRSPAARVGPGRAAPDDDLDASGAPVAAADSSGSSGSSGDARRRSPRSATSPPTTTSTT